MKVLACQIDVPVGTTTVAARDAYVARVTALDVKLSGGDSSGDGGGSGDGSSAATDGVDLVLLPELSTLAYSRECFENIGVVAEPAEGATFHAMSALAKRHSVHIFYGFARRTDDGKFCISHAAVDASGRRK
jgi:nitrilase